jgi:carboxypeptidase PM20D1
VAAGEATAEAAVARLQSLIRIPTVSDRDPTAVDPEPFEQLLEVLRAHYPRLHQLEVVRIGRHGLLIHWPGVSSADPVVLMAHLDVVPAVGEWRFPPYSGELSDGAIWGRGTLDDKGSVAAICEAVECALADGVVPARDVWLSFGGDEEVSGGGAAAAVAELRRRDVSPWFVLDEGGAVASEAFPGVAAPIAVVGVGEKGTTSLALTVTGDGGHASVPTRNAPTVRLAKAIAGLDGLAMPAHLPEPTIELLRRLAPHLPGPARPVAANLGRVAPLAARLLPLAGDEAAAMVRTTFAVTTLEGSPALNVIASTARAGVNVRVMVGDTVADVVAAVRRAVRDEKVEVSVLEANEASPLSPRDDAFALIESCVQQVFPDAVVAPYVMMAATDSRYFTAICQRVYRFTPFRMSKEQRAAIHAADEHLAVADFLTGVAWYRRLLEGLPA